MSKPIYIIQSNEITGNGQRKYMVAETHHDSLTRLAEALCLGPVVVVQCFTKAIPDEPGTYEITDRREVMITSAYVFSATVPAEGKKYVEYER